MAMFTKSFLKKLAKKESVPFSFLEQQLKKAHVVIPHNNQRTIDNPCAVGKGFKVKINTNFGLSPSINDVDIEIEKMHCAIKHGADTVMDLSVNENLIDFRKKVIANCTVPLGTVPVYEAALKAENKTGSFELLNFKDILEVLESQAQDGVDFFTIHAGILKGMLTKLKKKKRLGGIVSRGGAILARWMLVNKKENPFYDNFDTILELAKKYNVTLSLGDALRPGSIFDSTDDLQISELKVLGTLVTRCRKKGVQVMVEGPGHIRLDEIALNMKLEKKICHNAPFYVLGPLPTDIAAGYDHITGAIGGAIGAFNGADFLCVVTPAEHLRHPSIDDIRDGTIASKIAAHCVNLLRFKDEWKRDYELSKHRSRRNWSNIFPLTIDEEKAKKYRENLSSSDDICSMCGNFCSLKIIEKCDLLK
jgi:phosphomethylpyrimidine synthase